MASSRSTVTFNHIRITPVILHKLFKRVLYLNTVWHEFCLILHRIYPACFFSDLYRPAGRSFLILSR